MRPSAIVICPQRESLELPQRLRPRSVATALALAMAISPLLGILHEAGVRHVACPEDGDLIEEPVQAAHGHQVSADNSLFPERPLAPSAPGAGHEHCLIALNLLSHASARLSQPAAPGATAVIAHHPAAPEPPRLRAVALYRFAPKASPPV
jgi:hypothetical protein